MSRTGAAATSPGLLNGSLPLDGAVAAWEAESVRLDVAAGAEGPPAAGFVRTARRTIESQVDHRLVGAAGEIFALAKRKAHAPANVCRDAVGAALDAFSPAPRFAAVYRNCRAVLDDTRLNRLAMPPRIPWAIRRNLEPGWVPGDIETEAKDQTFAGRLKNLGQAVGAVSQ